MSIKGVSPPVGSLAALCSRLVLAVLLALMLPVRTDGVAYAQSAGVAPPPAPERIGDGAEPPPADADGSDSDAP